MVHEKVSKPGAVGEDMAGALAGRQDSKGPVSKNFEGKPRNADPSYHYRPSADNAQTVSDWTKNCLKVARADAAEKKKEEK